MKKSFSRIISALLTLCLVIGVLPGIALFEAKAAGDLYFNFIKGNMGTGKGTAHVKTITYDNTTAGNASELNTSIASQPWAFKSASAGVDGGGGYWAYMNNGRGLYLYANTNSSTADNYSGQIKFKVSTAGSYIPQLNLYGADNYSLETIFTATIYEYTASTDTLGDAIATRTIMYPSYDKVDEYVSLTNTPVSFKANTEYVLKLSTLTNCMGSFIVEGLRLADASSPIATEIKIGESEGSYTVLKGETLYVPMAITMSNGGSADLSKVSFNVSDSSAIAVTTAGNNLKIVANGGSKETVTVKMDGVSASFIVNVRESAITPGPLTYDFTKPVGHKDKKIYNQAYLENITFANTTNGAYGEIQDSVTSAPWAFMNSTVSGGNSYVKYNVATGTHGVAMYTRNDLTNFKIIVPADGMYTASANLRGTSPYIQLALYELNGDTLGKEIFRGINLGSTTDAIASYTVTDTPVALKAGKYVLQMKMGSQASAFAYLNQFTLNYTGAYVAPDSGESGGGESGGNQGGNQGGGNTGGGTVDDTKLTVSANVTKINATVGGTATATISVKDAYGTAVTPNTSLSGVDTSIANVTLAKASGTVTVTVNGKKAGETSAKINLTTTDGKSGSITLPIVVKAPVSTEEGGKVRSSYHTAEKVEAMRENAKLYDWANSTMRGYVNAAEKYVGEEERLWNTVTSQELPRSYYVGYRADPDKGQCRYCGKIISDIYGSFYYCWMVDAWNKPWKVTCPECRKSFPTNDFEKFYELGIDSDGFWNYELAKSENAKLVAAGQPGYLVNETLPEKGKTWGVDDGYGYVDTTKTYKDTKGNTLNSTHTYISFYNHWGLWHSGLIYNAVGDLAYAYLYTGDAKYGRVGAIMVDRIADVYPDMDTSVYRNQFTDGAYYAPKGKVSDYIWENQLAKQWAECYDAFWPMYEDQKVISFLNEKATKYGMANDKSTAALIRKNSEDNILRHIYDEILVGDIWGNFGMPQSTLALTAVVLDTMPETKEMLDFVFQDGEGLMINGAVQVNKTTGGNVNRQLINAVDANGVSDEVSPNYSALWLNGVSNVARYTAGYDRYPEADMYNNPRFVKMFTWQMDTALRRTKMPAIGDSGATGKDNDWDISSFHLIPAYRYTRDPRFAQYLYFLNGNKLDGLHYDATKKNPNSIQQDIEGVIREYGEYDLDKSLQLTDFGYSVLKSGSVFGDGTNKRDTQRAFWMYWGRGAGHGHRDALNLGIEAHGFDMAPDLGYPTGTTGDSYAGWYQTTVSHNTVVINDGRQVSDRTSGGIPYHFDDAGRVKVMDADATNQYKNVASIYRRIVVAVDIDEEDSYAVDFFLVNGGSEHVYSFHSFSDEIAASSGISTTAQSGGTYQGADVAYGDASKNSGKNGYNYLYNVKRDKDVAGGNFMIDFKIKDFRDYFPVDPDAHLKMTMVNGFDLSEVAIATGMPPEIEENPQELKWILARRSGTNLRSLFTTVFEPYLNDSKISKIEQVSVTRADGAALGADEDVKAVKVTLKDGRIDYVAFARRSSVEYNIGGVFNMKGIVGVYSVKDGKNIYSYVNDGTKIGNVTGTGSYTGKVQDFTKGIQFKNSITVSLDQTVDANSLIGKYIYVGTSQPGNATYEIKGVTKSGSNYVLDIGDITLVDKLDDSGNYVYKIANGSTFRIPVSLIRDSGPQITPIADQVADVGAEFVLNIKATASGNDPIKYSLVSGPSGITVDENTGKLTWIPQSSHRGTHAIVVKASNGGFDSTETFSITVFGGSPVGPAPGPGGGGGGGGGESKLTISFNTNGGSNVASQSIAKGALATQPADPTKEGFTFDGWYTDAELTTKYDFATPVNAKITLYAKWVAAEGETTEPETGDKRFTDLGNHKWAEDAIYRLVSAGVVNGTSATTYAPGVKITRADFTTLIVRAFKFEAEVATFKDVDPSKYYATPVGIAKTLGIVGGVNANDFAPTAPITRQDMMVIIYRALKAAGIEIEKTTSPVLTDMGSVAAYAKDAVEALTGAGLIAGSNGKINPKNNTTRAEVAVVLDRILNK